MHCPVKPSMRTDVCPGSAGSVRNTQDETWGRQHLDPGSHTFDDTRAGKGGWVMDLNSERPVRPALRALARLLLEAAEDNPRLVMRTARGMRNARNRCIASATISAEHRSKPAVAIAIPIKERRDRRRAAITTPPVVEQNDRTEPVVRADDRHNVLPPSLPWPTTGRSQASRGSRLRHVLSAVMVVAMILARSGEHGEAVWLGGDECLASRG